MSLSESRILQLALERLEEQKREIEAQIDEVRNRKGNQQRVKRRGRIPKSVGNQLKAPSVNSKHKQRRQMSAAQKKVISEKMKQRWAERRAEGNA